MLSPVPCTILAAGSQNIAQEFGLTSIYIPNHPVGMYVLGLGLGPLCLAPLSELHSRRIVYLCSFTLFTIMNIGCALSPRHYRAVNPADSLRDMWVCRANSWWSFNRRYVPTQRPRKSSGTLRTWTHSRASHWAISRGLCRQWNAKLEVAYVDHGYFVWIHSRILGLLLTGNICTLLAATESGKISEN